MDRTELEATKYERAERVATILLLLGAAVGLQALGASEGVVGGAVGAAAGLIMPGQSRTRAVVAAGLGALAFSTLDVWAPAVLS